MVRLLRVVEEVRKLYPRMELTQLALFLLIFANPTLRASDLGKVAGVGKSSLSRNVWALSQASEDERAEGGSGRRLDLITQIPDAFDGRAFNLALTKKGRSLGETLSQLMKE